VHPGHRWATPEGKKELIGFTDGMRESAESWRELLLDLGRCGLAVAPELAVADGALGFWKALGEVWPRTREQRCCWVHKAANVLNKHALQQVWMAEIKKDALIAFVRHRTIRSKGCLSNKTALAMVFKLVEAARKSWRRLRGYNQLPKVVQGVKFNDGIEVVRPQAQAAA